MDKRMFLLALNLAACLRSLVEVYNTDPYEWPRDANDKIDDATRALKKWDNYVKKVEGDAD